ncbi:hypothetical protein PENSPDRAFT_289063 [Peniophora sp. CONT]|nr:hypothetical protein PENSPDRAFT_289063 [Peniophora sp. CONT]
MEQQTQPDRLPHITRCLTGPLNQRLPLHAAGVNGQASGPRMLYLRESFLVFHVSSSILVRNRASTRPRRTRSLTLDAMVASRLARIARFCGPVEERIYLMSTTASNVESAFLSACRTTVGD